MYISDVCQDDRTGFLVTIITLVFTLLYVAMQAISSGYIFEVISDGKLSYEFYTILSLLIMIVLLCLGKWSGSVIK